MLGFIYFAVCRTTQMGYVGQTAVTPKRRWDGHVCDVAKGRHSNPRLSNAIKKYGAADFTLVTLEVVEAPTKAGLKLALTPREAFWLTYLRDELQSDVCNLMEPEDSMLGFIHSDETRKKTSEGLKGNTRRKGTSTSEEGRANISASKKGKPSPKRGTVMPLEQREKLSDAHRGKPLTEEHRAAQRAAAKGRTWTLVEGVRVYSKLQSKEP